MEEEEYIIINKTAIQKKINVLKRSLLISETNNDTIRAGIETSEIKQLEWCLSQSTPLIPEIEKAFNASKITTGMNQRNQFAYKYKNSHDYISNLKLDI